MSTALDPVATDAIREILADPALPVGTTAAAPDGVRTAALREAFDHLGSLRLVSGVVHGRERAADLVDAVRAVHPELAGALRWHATLGALLAAQEPGPARNAVLGDIHRGDIVTWATVTSWEWEDGRPPSADEPLRRGHGELVVEYHPGLYDAVLAWEPGAGALVVVPTHRGRGEWAPAGPSGWRVPVRPSSFHHHELVPFDAHPAGSPDWHEFPGVPAGAPSARTDPPRPPAPGSPELAAAVAEIAADQRRRLAEGGGRPERALQLVREHRLGAVRVPVELGGGGYDKRELFELVIALGAADPDVPHILRIHLGFVEEALRTRHEPQSRRWLDLAVAGKIFGGVSSELSGRPGVYTFDTKLTPDGADFRLNGQKFYSTGSSYSDYLRVTANTGSGAPDGTERQISAVIPADRAGIVHVDDWDGIGQRETGSGTTLLENVLVHPDELVEFRKLHPVDRPRGAQPQLLLHAIGAGILRTVVAESAELLRTRDRAYAWGNTPTAREDPQLQQVVGWLSSVQFVVEAAVLAAADAQERSSAYTFLHGAVSEELEAEASLQASKVKVGVEELALRAAGELFNAGGASWSRAAHHLDRHWRNLRTLFSHNPTVYKARAIGDLEINGTPLPPVGFF